MLQKQTRKFSPHIVAYVDILGVKEEMQTANERLLNKISELYDTSILQIRLRRRLLESERKVKFFSDNFVVTQPFDIANSNVITKSFLELIQSIQFCFSMAGYYLRGAIVIDNAYIDEKFVWGDALVKAYNLESKCAFYPRVIIDESVKSHLDVSAFDFLRIDQDGWLFVDYFYFDGDDGGRFPVLLKKIRDKVIDNYQKSKKEQSAFTKLKWLINYYNEKCKLSDKNEFTIDVDFTKELPETFNKGALIELPIPKGRYANFKFVKDGQQ